MPLSSYGQELGIWTDSSDPPPQNHAQRWRNHFNFIGALLVAVWG